jgi:hypothetical protein
VIRGPRAALKPLAAVLLDSSAPPVALARAASSLYALLLRSSGLEDDPAARLESRLPSGRALSPLDAARCVLDPLRTAVLLRGVDAAITAARERARGRRVGLLYAGTGPLAPLVLPLLPLVPAGSLRVTLLDVHPAAVAALRRVVERFGIGDAVADVLACDAAEWAPAPGTAIDVAVVETLQRSLSHEPQVAIVRNLVPRLAPRGVVVPESIRLELVLSDPDAEIAGGFASARAEAARVPVGTVFELSRRSAFAPLDAEGCLPPVVVTLPVPIGPGARPMIFTRIDAFGAHTLATAVSGLTVPEPLWQVPDLPAGSRLAFRYRLGSDPGLAWASPAPP